MASIAVRIRHSITWYARVSFAQQLKVRKLLLFVGSLNFLGAVVVSLSKNDQPKGFWGGWPYAVLLATAITLTAPPIQTWLADSGERKRRKALERERSIQELLTTALVAISRNWGVDPLKLGVQTFCVRTRVTWRAPFLKKRHERLAKVKLNFTVAPSGIEWIKGKGLIGQCWESASIVSTDLRIAFAPYAAFTQQQWEQLQPTATYGLTYAEFQKTKGYYGILAAAPILGSDKYLGCVSLDTSADCPSAVNINAATEELRATAIAIEQLLGMNSGS